MPKLFGIDMAKEIATAFKGELVAGTLTKNVPGTRTAGMLTGGTNPTTTVHAFEGFIEIETDARIADTLATQVGEIVAILGASISPAEVPTSGDKVNIEGRDFEIIKIIERDPAAALFRCAVKQ